MSTLTIFQSVLQGTVCEIYETFWNESTQHVEGDPYCLLSQKQGRCEMPQKPPASRKHQNIDTKEKIHLHLSCYTTFSVLCTTYGNTQITKEWNLQVCAHWIKMLVPTVMSKSGLVCWLNTKRISLFSQKETSLMDIISS